MIKLNYLTKMFAVAACLAACSVSNAQEAVKLQEDGSLTGNAFVAETAEKAADASITLTQEGQVVSTVNADEEGNFAFQNIEPGSYGLLGASDPYVGQSSFDVVPYSTGGCSSCSMGLESPETVYSSVSAPAQSFSASPCGGGCSSCGCGGGGGGLFSGGGGGGGLFSSRLFRLGAIGGVVAIATSGDDDDDASPDN